MNVELNLDCNDIKNIRNAIGQFLPIFKTDKNYNGIKYLQDKFKNDYSVVIMNKTELKKTILYVKKYMREVDRDLKYGERSSNWAVGCKQSEDLKFLLQDLNQARLSLEKYL